VSVIIVTLNAVSRVRSRRRSAIRLTAVGSTSVRPPSRRPRSDPGASVPSSRRADFEVVTYALGESSRKLTPMKPITWP
jgi:hypothetical protein